MPPDQLKFQEYYRHDLETAMREETRWFFRYVLRQNRPLSDFLDSNYTFLNQNLARHYGIENVVGSHFRRVRLPASTPRGGLIGHASVLTLSANGIDTPRRSWRVGARSSWVTLLKRLHPLSPSTRMSGFHYTRDAYKA